MCPSTTVCIGFPVESACKVSKDSREQHTHTYTLNVQTLCVRNVLHNPASIIIFNRHIHLPKDGTLALSLSLRRTPLKTLLLHNQGAYSLQIHTRIAGAKKVRKYGSE